MSKWEDFKKKGEQIVSSLDKNPKIQDVKNKAMNNPLEFILGGLMVLGLIFSYYWFGSLVVGLAAGLFAPWTIKDLLARGETIYKNETKLTSFMLGATVVFLLFHTFWFVIGTVAGSTIKLFLPKKAA